MFRLLKITIIFVICCVLCIAATLGILVTQQFQPFDQKIWANVKLYTSDNTRYRMYRSLVHKYGIKGMSKYQIVVLLGPQSDQYPFSDSELHYWLGKEPGIVSVRDVWLILKFQNNKVSSYRLVSQ